jgi:hypothetical protein
MVPRWVYPIAFLSLAVGVLAASLLFVQPPAPEAPNVCTKSGLVCVFSKDHGITKFVRQRPGGETFYRLIGHFPDRIVVTDDAITGSFVIDEDPTQTAFPVSLPLTSGTAQFIQFPSSLEDETEPTTMSPESILDLVRSDTPAAVFVLSTQSQLMTDALEGALDGTWGIPVDQPISLMTAGVVVRQETP